MKSLLVALVVLAALVLSPLSSAAQITFDTVVTITGAESAGTATLTYTSVTINNAILYCFIGFDHGLNANASATYGGTSMTAIVEINQSATAQYLKAFSIIPTVGAHTVAFTWTPGTGNSFGAGCLGYNGVSQTSPNGPSVTSGASVTSLSDVIISAPGSLALDFVSVHGGLPTFIQGGGQTPRVNQFVATDFMLGASQAAGADAVTMSWTWDGTPQTTGHILISVHPVGFVPRNSTLQWTSGDSCSISGQSCQFSVWRCEPLGCSSFTKIGTAAQVNQGVMQTFVDVSAPPNSCYEVRDDCPTCVGNSGFTNTACDPIATPPSPPSGLHFTSFVWPPEWW